jgi:hypothetical protein
MPRIDLNRMRKIYPSKKKQPHWFNQTNEVKTHKIDFSNSSIETVAIGLYNSPIVLLGKNDNVNVWISAYYQEVLNGPWRIEIKSSAVFTGEVYVHVAEGNP